MGSSQHTHALTGERRGGGVRDGGDVAVNDGYGGCRGVNAAALSGVGAVIWEGTGLTREVARGQVTTHPRKGSTAHAHRAAQGPHVHGHTR